ncbi:MAG TPA: SulP family inorganic anion transporter [Accumulibacter sp.]|uniref:Putative sulfate transporterc n=2 Tax=Candidatus Accumulibacter TaxID=327159 RepID=A0A080MAX9_9PROT|nr:MULTISPECIES: SulP family inorganic anion transporter [Candidatus Accumulibacter]MCC2869269.1 STAS domain-containing protein [Candidatus Accumulibacter phosphatis]KFB77580.1 MAG: putative sulfate transporterc [Candidatus Accumulibacter cognatus]MBL8401632.1 STAS domain-containing protein [Accumulibacter sp.]MBN8516416.1 STAS domain-containing protein [Accumulibacter sp.]MCM8580983.1 SulP family inorganic anion transporter [Accumulibacter sp.]
MPFWLKHYRRELLAGDLAAGVIVALMLIPQGMAYAMVAGLPPVAGLYASILPPIAYAVFGSSMVQSVGPMAITSLMTGASLAAFAPPGSALSVVLAGQMALIAGVVLFLSGVFRLGFLAGFLSRPVMSGFTTGAALLITGGQMEPLLGGPPAAIHLPSAIIGVSSLLTLWAAKQYLAKALRALGLSTRVAETLARLAPVAVLVVATAVVGVLGLAQGGVKAVGEIPSGIPGIALSVSAEHWRALLVPGVLVAFMIFLSSQSAAQSLAQKRGERITTNRELLGLGAANVASALSGGLPVTGSISRSAVNYSAGANTPLASMISAALVVLILVVPTPWVSLLPLPALAATIILAVLGMIDLTTLRDSWRYDRGDAGALLATVAGVLLLGVEEGVILGVVLSLATLIWRTSRPHIAVIGRIAGSEHFRNVERHDVETLPAVLMLRVDADLYFGNVDAVVDRLESLLKARATQGRVTCHVVLVMSAVSLIDTTGLYALTEISRSLRAQGTKLHLTEVKGPVMDRLQQSDFLGKELSGQVFLSTAQAFRHLAAEASQAG